MKKGACMAAVGELDRLVVTGASFRQGFRQLFGITAFFGIVVRRPITAQEWSERAS